MTYSDEHSQISRRHVVQSLLAAWLLPSVSRASPSNCPPQPPVAPGDGESRAAAEGDFVGDRSVKLIGVGDAGGNTVDYMIACGLQGVEFIYANTDAVALERSATVNTIELRVSGLGTDSRPDIGRAAANAATAEIRAAIEGARLVFITAGMGGGSGTGAAPVIARIAKEMGILSVGLVTMPFEWEGDRRLSQAEAGLLELQANTDALIVLHNGRLLLILGDEVTQDEAFDYVNEQMKLTMVRIVKAIAGPKSRWLVS